MKGLTRELQFEHLIKVATDDVERLKAELRTAEERLSQKISWRDSVPPHTAFNPLDEGYEFILHCGSGNNEVAIYHRNEEMLSLEYRPAECIWEFTIFQPAFGHLNGKSLFKRGIRSRDHVSGTSLVYNGPIESNEHYSALLELPHSKEILNQRKI